MRASEVCIRFETFRNSALRALITISSPILLSWREDYAAGEAVKNHLLMSVVIFGLSNS